MNSLSSVIGPSLGVGATLAHGVQYYNDFVTAGFLTNTAGRAGEFDETADSGNWLVTVTDSGGDNNETILVADGWENGWLACKPNNAAADGMGFQLNGEAFRVRPNKIMLARCRLAPSVPATTRWFFGFANTNAANPCAASSSWTDYIGFGNYNANGLDGTPDGSIGCIIGRDATEADAIGAKTTSSTAFERYIDSGIDFAGATTGRTADYSRELAVVVTGDRHVAWYIDGKEVTGASWNEPYPSHASSTIPYDVPLTPTFGFAAVDTSQPLLYVDYVHFFQER